MVEVGSREPTRRLHEKSLSQSMRTGKRVEAIG